MLGRGGRGVGLGVMGWGSNVLWRLSLSFFCIWTDFVGLNWQHGYYYYYLHCCCILLLMFYGGFFLFPSYSALPWHYVMLFVRLYGSEE